MERIDDLQFQGLKLIQDDECFCFGVDAILLSHFARYTPSDVTVDLCSGNGIVAVLLAGKTKAKKIYAVEIQEKLASLAKRSIELNNLSDRVEVICDNLKNIGNHLEKSCADVVTVNPPYFQNGGAIKNKKDEKMLARHEISCNLEDVISVSSAVLKTGGHFFMVHKPERLVDIFCLMRKYEIEPKRLCMVHPSVRKKANIVLIEGVYKGGRELKMCEPLYVFDEDGKYTKEIDEIYERGKYNG